MKYTLGEKAEATRVLNETDIERFAEVSGDLNPIHLDEKVAKESFFGNRIAHGFLVGSLISKVIGMQLPGQGTIYLEQNMIFKKPVYIGDIVTAVVEITDIINEEKGILRLSTKIKKQNGDIVIDGYAVVQAPDMRTLENE